MGIGDWYSEKNLKLAWGQAVRDSRDNFMFDIINHEDIKTCKEFVLDSLARQIQNDEYQPANIQRVGVPKKEWSVRPGTVIHIVDLIVLYAIIQQIAFLLDKRLSKNVYSFRYNEEANKNKNALFKPGIKPDEKAIARDHRETVLLNIEEEESEVSFPYDWFYNWLRFYTAKIAAAKKYPYRAVTDITAYFENIPLEALRAEVLSILPPEYKPLAQRLFSLFEYWNWTAGSYPENKIGLPQGNEVSSFLANIYLGPLDKAIEKLINEEEEKYFRYVDDIALITDDKTEGNGVLLACENELRKLHLNLQTAKTKVELISDDLEKDTDDAMRLLDRDNPDRVKNARELIGSLINEIEENKTKLFLPEKEAIFETLIKWERINWDRVYRRSLSVLTNGNDDFAIDLSFKIFRTVPEYRMLLKNFQYLARFVWRHDFTEKLVPLIKDGALLPFHRATVLRLAGLYRAENANLKQLAYLWLDERNAEWFVKVAALYCLMTFELKGNDLDKLSRIQTKTTDPSIIRAVFVCLAQNPPRAIPKTLDKMAEHYVRHQEYLKKYMSRLVYNEGTALRILSRIKKASIKYAYFINCLHQLDLIKANSERSVKRLFWPVLEDKIADCSPDWDRLRRRLTSIKDRVRYG